MKFTDVRTLESVLAEYGMSSGASTPTSQQKTGATAKANAKPTTTKAPAKVDKGSPTVTPGLDVKDAEPEKVEPTYTKSKAKDIEVDAEYHNDKGEVAGKVVSKVGNNPNPDKVVIQDPKGEYQLVDPDEEVQVLNASKLSKLSKSTASSFNIKKHSKKRLAKLKTNMKKLVRKFKLREQGPEAIFEINFNRKNVAKSALTSPIKCGFEAETVFQDVQDRGDDEEDWLYEYNWYDIEEMVASQDGQGSVDTINEAYREWIYEKAYDLEGEILQDIVIDRKEDEDELNDFVESMLDEDDIEAYKEEELDGMDDEQKEEFEDWDFIAWGRQYTEERREDEYIEWLEEKIRDGGEALEQAVEQAEMDYNIDQWAYNEWGGWSNCLSEHGIYIYNENSSGEGVGEVANLLGNWATNNSQWDDIEHGDYHSTGSGEDYWRVETDSSIEVDYGTGAEVISPVYDTPKEMMEEMKSLFDWFKGENVETNTSTGLHVTMSWNGQSYNDGEVNPVKLAVLLGDKYLLSTFGRSGNSYAKSQIKSLQKAAQELKADPENLKSIKKIESIIGKGIDRGKFSSINFKDQKDRGSGSQLIEFRIGGGTDYHLNFNTVAKAVIRYAETLKAAYNDDMYKTDYVKALFKVINSLDEVDPKDIERVKGRFETELPIVDVIKDYYDKSIYIDSMDTVAVAVNSLMKYRELSHPDADEQWKQSIADYEERTGKKVDIEEDDEPSTGTVRPYHVSPSKQAQVYLKKAQDNIALAIGQAGFDLSTNKSRTKPNAKSIGTFRKALADFELTYQTLDKLILQQEDRIQVGRTQPTPQQKLSTIQNGVNKLFKKDVVTLPAFLSGPDSERIVKGLWSAAQSGKLQDGEQNKKFFNAIAGATNVNAETIASAWDSVNKSEFKRFNTDLVSGSYQSTGINGNASWFPVGGPVNKAGLKKLLTHLEDYEEWNHPVMKGHNPNTSGDDSYTDNALNKMNIKLRKRFDEIQRLKDIQPAQHYDMLKVIAKALEKMIPAVQATEKMIAEIDPSLRGVEPHGTSQDGLDYFGMRSGTAEQMITFARQLKDPNAPDPFNDAPVIQIQQYLQSYLNDVFERNHLAKAKYGADVFTKGKLPQLIKSRTDAISNFINTIDKLGQDIGFDSTGIDIDKKKQLPKKQQQFMKKHGDPSVAKIKAFSFGGDIMVSKEFAKEIETLSEREFVSRLQQTSSIHSTNYKDILIMPWAHSSAMRNAIEILNQPEKYKENWRWPVAQEMKSRFVNKYGQEYETMFKNYVSYNEDGIKQMLQSRGVVFTDELGDGREPNFSPLVVSSEAKGPNGEPFDLRSAQVWKMNNESVFKKFDNLPLEEQINIINKVSKDKIDRLYEQKDDLPSGYHKWKVSYKDGSTKEVIAQSTFGVRRQLGNGKDVTKKELGVKSIKKIPQIGRKPKGSFGFNNKGFTKDRRELKKFKDKEFEKDPASYSHRVEESVPDFKQVDTINRLMADHFPVGDLKKQMLAYQAIPVPAMLDHFRQLRAEAGDDACARNIVRMFTGALPKEQQARLDLNESALSEAPMDILDKYDAQQQKYFELKYRVQQACQNPRTANACNKISAELPAIENELKRLRQEIASYTAREADVDAAIKMGGEQRELDIRRAKASLKKQVVALVKKAEGIADNEIEAKNFNKVQNSIADKLNGIISGIEEDEKISLVALGKLLDHAMKGELIDTKSMVSAKQGKIDDHVNRNLDPEVLKIFDEYFKGDIFEFIPGGTTSGNYGPAEVGLAIFGNPAKKAETHGDLEIDGVMYELKGSGFKRLKSGKLGSSIYGARLNSKGISSGTNGWGPLEKGIKKIAPTIKELNPSKDPKEAAKEPGFMRYISSAGKQASRYNLNAKGIQFLNDEVLGPYSDKKKTTELLLGIIKGIMPGWKRVPEFEKIVGKMSNEDGTLSLQRLWSFYTGLAYESYNIEDGVENILFINSNTRSYFIINNRDEMIKAIAQGKVEVTGGISWNDDQMKASPQYAIR